MKLQNAEFGNTLTSLVSGCQSHEDAACSGAFNFSAKENTLHGAEFEAERKGDGCLPTTSE